MGIVKGSTHPMIFAKHSTIRTQLGDCRSERPFISLPIERGALPSFHEIGQFFRFQTIIVA